MERERFVVIEKEVYDGDKNNIYFKVVTGSRRKELEPINLRKRYLCTLILDRKTKEFKLMEKFDNYSAHAKKQLLEVLQSSYFTKRIAAFRHDSKLVRTTFCINDTVDEALDLLSDEWKGR